jgi:hypothetical protein
VQRRIKTLRGSGKTPIAMPRFHTVDDTAMLGFDHDDLPSAAHEGKRMGGLEDEIQATVGKLSDDELAVMLKQPREYSPCALETARYQLKVRRRGALSAAPPPSP